MAKTNVPCLEGGGGGGGGGGGCSKTNKGKQRGDGGRGSKLGNLE